MTTENLTAEEAAQVRRMVARLRRMLADAPAGVARADLRRRLNSREKHLFDAAMSLLIAVGDVDSVPAYLGGTRYRIARVVAEQSAVGPTSDEETGS